MKRFALLVLAASLFGASVHAVPPAVGEVSADLGYSEGTVFFGGAYTTLEQRHLSDHEGKVIVMLYFAPW